MNSFANFGYVSVSAFDLLGLGRHPLLLVNTYCYWYTLDFINHHHQVYNSDELMNCIWDFLNAGTETSSTTLKWALLYLTIHQVGF